MLRKISTTNCSPVKTIKKYHNTMSHSSSAVLERTMLLTTLVWANGFGSRDSRQRDEKCQTVSADQQNWRVSIPASSSLTHYHQGSFHL